MKYTIAKSAAKLMEINKIKVEDLVNPPENGKSYTKQDIRTYLETLGGFSFNDEIEEDEKDEGLLGDLSVAKELAAATEDNKKEETVEDLPLILEFFWDDRAEANEKVKTGKYLITDVISIKNAPWGLHKKIVLRRI